MQRLIVVKCRQTVLLLLRMDRIIRNINLNNLLEKLCRYGFDRNIFYHNSIDSYYSGEEPSFWRKVKFYLRFLVLIVLTMKSGLNTLFPETLLLRPLIDATILYGKQSIFFHAVQFSLCMVSLFAKSVVFYYESKKNLKIFDIIVDLKAGKQKYQMSQKHIKKISFRSYLLYYGYLRITSSIAMLLSIFVHTSITIGTYLYCDYGNVINLWLWTIIIIIAFNQVIIIVLYGAFWFYIPITVLNYRLDELIDELRVSIRWNNMNAIHRIIESYDELISDCQQLSGTYNVIIGLVYCLVPYVIALFFEMMKIERNDLLFKLLKNGFIIAFIITNINAFIINQLSASITVRNKSIHKYLYPMFFSNMKIRIRTKLTIDSFIARLNTQFIGFYCFNLFKFTKKAFYEYALIVSTCYFLIINVVKN